MTAALAAYNSGLALARKGDVRGALAALDSAIGKVPKQPLFHLERGRVLRRLDRHVEAVGAFADAALLDESGAEARDELAETCKALKTREGPCRDPLHKWQALLPTPPGLTAAEADEIRQQLRVASGRCHVSSDPGSGNQYEVCATPSGDKQLTGYNPTTGSRWTETYGADGLWRGVDKDGERWRYDPRTEAYASSSGLFCIGSGERRLCNR